MAANDNAAAELLECAQGPAILPVTIGGDQFVAIKAGKISVTTHQNTDTDAFFGAVTIAGPNRMALYFEHGAQDLRELAAACLDCATKLDKRKGLQ